MNLLGVSILVVLLAVVLCASRRIALLAMLAGVLYLTQEQQVDVLGFNLYAYRFLNLAGFIRVLSRREFSFRGLTGIDRALLWLYGYATVVFLLRSVTGQGYQVGLAVNAFLCYFTFRGLIADIDDCRWFLRAFLLLLAPFALLVMVESLTGHNLFTVLGGIAGEAKWMRHGRPRCFGSFRQPDTLGMFAASFLPLYVGMICIARERWRAILGVVLCLAIVQASNSGGPVSAAAVGLVGWLFWRVRTTMRKVRWGLVLMLTAMALTMKAPIWYIFDRASSITGGDGWHRSYLIDVFYQHLGRWWLAGMPNTETSGWMPYDLATAGGADITNQYLCFGMAAGLGAIGLFILLLKRAYSALGLAMSLLRSASATTDEGEFLLWGLGAVLTVHIINWFGIAYFDQMYVIWFMQLAAVSSLSNQIVMAAYEEPPAVTVDEVTDVGGSEGVNFVLKGG